MTPISLTQMSLQTKYSPAEKMLIYKTVWNIDRIKPVFKIVKSKDRVGELDRLYQVKSQDKWIQHT